VKSQVIIRPYIGTHVLLGFCCWLTCTIPRQYKNITFILQAVFVGLEENCEYAFEVRAHTSRGSGPMSERVTSRTERDAVRAPLSVHALATSESSVEVWWEPVPGRNKVVGYQVMLCLGVT
jgi:hypothetical protein